MPNAPFIFVLLSLITRTQVASLWCQKNSHLQKSKHNTDITTSHQVQLSFVLILVHFKDVTLTGTCWKQFFICSAVGPMSPCCLAVLKRQIFVFIPQLLKLAYWLIHQQHILLNFVRWSWTALVNRVGWSSSYDDIYCTTREFILRNLWVLYLSSCHKRLCKVLPDFLCPTVWIADTCMFTNAMS